MFSSINSKMFGKGTIMNEINNNEILSLREKILDDCNIYNAIYSLESYVFDKGLLDSKAEVKGNDQVMIAKSDLELYYALGDKYNADLITKVIDACKSRLKDILDPDKKELFEISVYFRMKKVDDKGKLIYRPMHTARLIDMICMVCILTWLMYDDDNEKRSLSELSKLIPHNFYGNLPSTDVQYLFKAWKLQYKAFSDDVIENCRNYKNNHRYLTEVTLDIQNFFPSVSPEFLYNLIIDKLSATFSLSKDGKPNDDLEILKIAVAKLLYFKISPLNIESWQEEYYIEGYQKGSGNSFYMNCGIPQGLPQSYFFGNLCMLEVKKRMMSKELFDGDAYFYVDDSVIYIKSELDVSQFNDKIEALNDDLESLFEKSQKKDHDFYELLPKKSKTFQEQLKYKVKFHTKGKSSCIYIDDADNHLDGLQDIKRCVSNSGSLFWSLDDIDDSISYKKLCAIKEVIDAELKQLQNKKNETDKGGKVTESEAARIKLLKRYKKYFLYRISLFNLKIDLESENRLWDSFTHKLEQAGKDELGDWLERNEEEIFQSEYRLLIEKISQKKGKEIKKQIENFESEYTQKNKPTSNFLYYQKDVENSIAMKAINIDKYASLRRWVKENYSGNIGLKQTANFSRFCEFLKDISSDCLDDSCGCYCPIGIEKCSRFVRHNSPDFLRRILNVYFSESIGVRCSDDHSFIKSNSKKLCYTELRILLRLRNRNFEFNEFERFVASIDNDNISNQMKVDMALIGVLGTFIHLVKNPDWIDDLIQTHRITKGLWYNGSKFLNAYTLHNEEHAVALVNQAAHIVKTIDYFDLKSIDYYILFLACYLHDISMVIHPDLYKLGSPNSDTFEFVSEQVLKMQKSVSEFFGIYKKDDKMKKRNAHYKEAGNHLIEVFEAVYDFFSDRTRERHHIDSANFILSKAHSLLDYLEPTLLSFVAKVSESHGWDYKDVYGLKSRAKRDTVSLKYLMILIRLADSFDVANDRVNYHLLRQNVSFLSDISRFHWISHLITDKLEFDADYETHILDTNGVDLYDKPITEKLIVRLYLNVKYLTTVTKQNQCEGCECSLEDGNIHIRIIGGPEKDIDLVCKSEKCTLMCFWMMKKHEWLIKELRALKEYLFSVNNSLISTQIEMQIICKNDMKLDADLFDDVSHFLKVE